MAETEENSEEAFNVLNHGLVPIHEIMGEQEKQRVLEAFQISPEQLPKINADDAAARAIGAKAGQVLRVRRKSKTAGEAIAYRIVVDFEV